MNPKELRSKSMEELEKMKVALEAEIADSYFEMRTGKAKNVRKPRLLRKGLALIVTIINETKNNVASDKMSPKKHE